MRLLHPLFHSCPRTVSSTCRAATVQHTQGACCSPSAYDVGPLLHACAQVTSGGAHDAPDRAQHHEASCYGTSGGSIRAQSAQKDMKNQQYMNIDANSGWNGPRRFEKRCRRGNKRQPLLRPRKRLRPRLCTIKRAVRHLLANIPRGVQTPIKVRSIFYFIQMLRFAMPSDAAVGYLVCKAYACCCSIVALR